MAYVKPYGGQLNIWRVGLGERSKKSDRDSGAREALDLIPSTSTEFAPEYSPDGKRVAFESDRTGSLEIWTCQSDGANCSSLTSLGTPATGLPHWSPDGRKIVFYSRPKKEAQIYLINSEGGEPRRLTNDKWENFFSGLVKRRALDLFRFEPYRRGSNLEDALGRRRPLASYEERRLRFGGIS